jgi:Xaa-Pro aminopeptidase
MSVHAERRAALFERLPAGLDAVALGPGPSLRYLTGYAFDRVAWGQEPPLFVVLTPDGGGAVLPELEAEGAADHLPGELCTYGNSPADAVTELEAGLDLGPPLGVEPTSLRLREASLLPGDSREYRDVSADLAALRARKDDRERALFREAGRITDDVLGAALEWLEPGVTERELERYVHKRTLDSDAEAVGSGVVTSGPRTAIVQASTTDREIDAGEPVLIDTGVVHGGYYTDVTRTVVPGQPADRIADMHELVREAAAAAREAAEPEMTAGDLDAVAREVIEEAGYGAAFRTGLGHGVGLDSHEPPVLEPGNDTPLEAGNVVTVEPGVYVDNVGGVRVEDDVLLVEGGAETLTGLDRSMDAGQ